MLPLSERIIQRIGPYEPVTVKDVRASGVKLSEWAVKLLRRKRRESDWRGNFVLGNLVNLLDPAPEVRADGKYVPDKFNDEEVLRKLGLGLCLPHDALFLRLNWDKHKDYPDRLVRVGMKPVQTSKRPHDFPKILVLEKMADETLGISHSSCHPNLRFTGDFWWIFREL